MKKIFATAATLLLAFGSVALSTNFAAADDAVVDPTAVVETLVVEPAATEPAPTEAAPAVETAAQVTSTEVVVTEEPVVTEPVEVTEAVPATEAASFAAAPQVETLDVALVGVVGELLPWSPATNDPDYWENYTDHEMQCYKHEGNSDHGYISDGGKTVTLNAFNQDWWGDHWELLVVKGGSDSNNVIVHPSENVAYASPLNSGGQQSNVSHWIVCKGVTPDVETPVASASVQTTPGTCEAPGSVSGTNAVNAEFGEPVYANGTYTIVATATGNAKFEPGDGVSDDGTTKTFTGQVPPQNTELCEGTVTFCHAHPADTAKNGWELMSNMPVQSVNGHTQHAADIIPPVPGILPQGLNWNASFVVNGVELTAQEILRLGCEFDVEVPGDPTSSDEYCSDGKTQDGSISVLFGDLGAKIEYRITGDGVDITIKSGDATTVYLPAGDYTVTAEAVAPYELTGQDEWEFTIGSAVNCECAVGSIDKIAALVIVEDPECAEAEVSVTPATCLAAAGLVAGDTLHATFGEPVIEDGTYTLIATADDGYRFFPGTGVSDDGSTKTFTGELASKLTGPCDLTTLALTGSGADHTAPIVLAGFAVLLGMAAVHRSRRTKAAR